MSSACFAPAGGRNRAGAGGLAALRHGSRHDTRADRRDAALLAPATQPEAARAVVECGHQLKPPHGEVQSSDIVLPLKLRDIDGVNELAFFSTLSTFGTAVDITLAELSIEAFYPANAHTAMRLLRDIDAAGAD